MKIGIKEKQVIVIRDFTAIEVLRYYRVEHTPSIFYNSAVISRIDSTFDFYTVFFSTNRNKSVLYDSIEIVLHLFFFFPQSCSAHSYSVGWGHSEKSTYGIHYSYKYLSSPNKKKERRIRGKVTRTVPSGLSFSWTKNYIIYFRREIHAASRDTLTWPGTTRCQWILLLLLLCLAQNDIIEYDREPTVVVIRRLSVCVDDVVFYALFATVALYNILLVFRG